MAVGEFISLLEETFFTHAAESATVRRTALAEAVARGTADLAPDEARALIDEARRRLGEGEERPAAVEPAASSAQHDQLAAENQELQSRIEHLEHELKLRSAAYDRFVDLSEHFLGDGARFEREEQIERFCERIKNSFGILMSAFKNLLKGRKRFQMEYAMYFGMGKSMEGTRIIRTGEDKDVGKKFFEWDTLENVEESSTEMERALDELKYHQLAFLSGYKRSVKEGTLNAIRPLSPEQLEQELAEEKFSLGPLKIPYSVLPWKRGRLYKEYRRRYEDLIREDVQYFEAKFRTAFTSGYVEVMNRKAKAQQES
jgi:hypothetical protein